MWLKSVNRNTHNRAGLIQDSRYICSADCVGVISMQNQTLLRGDTGESRING